MSQVTILNTFLGAILVISSLTLATKSLSFSNDTSTNNNVLGVHTDPLSPIKTLSSFTTKIITNTIVVPKHTITKNDPETEVGTEIILKEGHDGQEIKTIKVTYSGDQEYEREILTEKVIPAEDKIVVQGTKIIWRTIDTANGSVRYWKKLHVWATQYDSHCLGCDSWTATGLHQGKGVIAVDPKVIRLGSKVYIPEYGEAIAGDTGGAVKGNYIDLGFEDAKTSGWYSHYIDIYLL